MKKLIKRAFYSTLLFLVLIAGLLFFLIMTTPGLHTLIKLSSLYLPGSLKVQHLEGTLLKQFTIEELVYQNDQATIKVKHLFVNWQIKSLLKREVVIKDLNADSIEINQADSITNLEHIKLVGRVNQQQLIVNSLQFNFADQTFYSELKAGAKPPYALSGKIKLNPDLKNQVKLNGTLDIGGTLNQLQWTGDFHGPIEISVNGSLKELSELNQITKWRDFQWKNDEKTSINSPEGRIKLFGVLPNLAIELSTRINQSTQDNWQLNANIHGTIPWKWSFDANLSQTSAPSSKVEGLYTSLNAKGMIEDTNKGSMTLTIRPGHYQMPDKSIIPSLQFQGGVVNISLSPKHLSGTGSLGLDDSKKLTVAFKLPKFDLGKGLSDTQPLTADLSLVVSSFDFLKNISPYINNPKGQLTATLKISGTWGKKIIKSALSLGQGSVVIPQLGLKLSAIDLTVQAKKQLWEAAGSIVSAGKKILVKGHGLLSPSFNGDISLQGSDFGIINTKEYLVNISPQVNLNVSQAGLNITGSILIPLAQIKPQTFSNSIALSDDVVFKTNKEAPSTPFNTTMDLRVEMGNEVELTVKGLHATLGGMVHFKQVPQGSINAVGELSVSKGEYKAYGQDLTIQQGELIFTGGGVTNPGINLRAAKKIDTTTTSTAGSNQAFDFNNTNLQSANVRGNISVGVEVSGRLAQPKIVLFSNPSILSQADILSMLVLGRPANQADKAGGQLLLAAISSMNLGNGTNGAQLLEQLKKNLGLDLSVQTTNNYNLATNQFSDNTAVVVGKSLSKRIYVSYNVGLSQSDPNVLTLKYLLNKFYSIQVSNSTTSNGIDILYTSSK